MSRGLAWLLGIAVILAAWWFAGHPGWESREQQVKREQESKIEAGVSEVYRWKDDKGVTQITQTPPKGLQYTIIKIRDDQNIIESEAPVPEPPQ